MVLVANIAAVVANAAGAQEFTIPAPVITPIVGYGTIFTGALAIIGMVGLFYGMRYSLNSALADLKEIKLDIKTYTATINKVDVQGEKLKSLDDRLHNIENQLYSMNMGYNFGRTSADRSRASYKERPRGSED